jgi:hypothetical protein
MTDICTYSYEILHLHLRSMNLKSRKALSLSLSYFYVSNEFRPVLYTVSVIYFRVLTTDTPTMRINSLALNEKTNYLRVTHFINGLIFFSCRGRRTEQQVNNGNAKKANPPGQYFVWDELERGPWNCSHSQLSAQHANHVAWECTVWFAENFVN